MNILLSLITLTLFQLNQAIPLTITVRQTKSGQYDILVDGEEFFPGSTRNVTLHNHVLKLTGPTIKSTAIDKLGQHQLFTTEYAAGDTKMVTSARVYESHIIFSQSFPNGANNTATGDRDAVLGAFPSFAVAKSTVTGRRGYLQFQGDMVGAGYNLGEWDDNTTNIASGIKGTGPLVIFQQTSHLAVVMSPFTNAMAANQAYSNNILDYGIMGNVTDIPIGYEISTIVSFAEGSVNNAMMTWVRKR